jgi:hypothetical protein
LNGISAGYGLGVLLVGGLFGCQALIIFTRQIYRADGGTLTTAGTFGKVNIARVFPNAGFKIPRLAFEF